ncbi:MAG TPA: hypothetical protein PLJ47_04450 [Candidatus Hydrogenedentes bacterium]|nr:hypothetical protein [Candidatus Hydrogenedentota bacterium]HRK33827.1 hypothetical protein [Candidatus Hydrogenedentota bacterium]
MSRIFEALEYAGLAPVEEPENNVEVRLNLPRPIPSFEEKLLGLYQRIDALVENRSGRIVSFAGLTDGDDSSTYVLEMARAGSVRLGKRILVLATCNSGCAKKLRDSGLTKGWEGISHSARSINDVVYQISEPPIAISQLNATKDALPTLLASPRFMNTLRLMRKRYDWIFIDTPPMNGGFDAAMLSPIADGTVVVVNAGKVRWQVVRHAVDQIAAQQGNVLGVALNRRRYVIPDFIYRQL